jgi:peptidylprolyl isomerase
VAKAKEGDRVKVHYAGKLSNGTEFDSSAGRDPLEFVIAEGGIIPGFENAVIGMAAGEKKSVTIAIEDGYGSRRDELMITINKSELPSDIDPKVDDMLEMRQGEDVFPVRVTAVAEDELSFDANHPLAGEVLEFNIELVEIA